ncbi:MAG: hypothetical protein PHC86_08955 [Eubacteriales bacterium]|nr:hypothetical protein [Eubacteriales bacterium]
MIELFSRRPNWMLSHLDSDCAPLHVSDEVSSLSSILLDEEYYQLLLNGRTLINGMPVLDSDRLIPFKAKAWLDLSDRKETGESVDSKDISKHKNYDLNEH